MKPTIGAPKNGGGVKGQKRRPICLSVSFTWHGTLATSLPTEHGNIYRLPLVEQMI